MENQENDMFENHFLDLNCETDYSNSSYNDSVSLHSTDISGKFSSSVNSDKTTYDFSYVQESLPTKDALGYLAIDKFVLGIILDAKTAAKTRCQENLDIQASIINDGSKFNDEGKLIWATKQPRGKRDYFLSHKLEIKEAVSCINKCGFKSSNQLKLKYHMNNCLMRDSDKPYTCPECGHKSGIDKDHHDHLMSHVTSKPFKCFYCDKMCKSNGYFRDHFLSQHKAVKSFKCSICSFQTVKRNCLQSHMASHISKKREKCNICSEKFKDSVGLKIHMRTHTTTGDNPWKVKRSFTCNLCGQKYKQKAALQRHLYSHQDKGTGESINPLKCSMCLFSCKQGAKLQRHMINCHPESVDCQPDGSIGKCPYACTICESRFVRAADLQNHMKSHMKSVKQVDQVVVESVETEDYPFYEIVNEDMLDNDE